MIFSESGIAESNCVFRTKFPERGEMVWTVTRYDESHAIEFAVFSPGSHVWKLGVELKAEEQDNTTAVWTHTYTALTEKGNEFIDNFTDEAFQKRMSRLEESLEHFCRTGEMLEKNWD